MTEHAPGSSSRSSSSFLIAVGVVVLLLVGLILFLVFGGAERQTASESVMATADSVTGAAAAGGGALGSMATVQARDEEGREGPLAPAGGGVVLIISETCSHCHALLGQWGRLTGGAALPRLRVLTVEGAAAGREVSEGFGVSAGGYVQPAGSVGELAQALEIEGTPALLRVDAQGQVLARHEGELSEEQSQEWIAWSR